MQIKDLPSSSTFAATDVLAKDASVGTTTKINGTDLASSVKTLGSLLGTSDVVNDLTNGSTNPVSSGGVNAALNTVSSGDSGVTAATGVTLNHVYLRKVGKLVIFRCLVQISDTLGGNTALITTLPEGYRPSDGEILFDVFSMYNSTTTYSYNSLGILNDGKVRTRAGSSTFRGTFAINVSFFTA